MKKCPNPHCTSGIYSDDFVRCPLCDVALEDVQSLTVSLPAEALSEATTSPYQPVGGKPGPYDGSGEPQYVQQSMLPEGEWPGDSSMPLRTVAPNGLWGRVRTILVAAGGFVVVMACLVLVLSLSNRFSQRSSAYNGPGVANATVVSRPAVNTPILGVGDRGSGVGVKRSVEVSKSIQNPKPAHPLGDQNAAILDATMCAKLESGQPVGATATYHPSDAFNLAIKAEFGPGGVQAVSTRWYGPDGAQVYEMRHSYPQHGTFYTAFTVSKNAPWAPGDYRADIYTNDSPQPVQSVPFSISP